MLGMLTTFLILVVVDSLSTSTSSDAVVTDSTNRRKALLQIIGTTPLWLPSAVYAISDEESLNDLPMIEPNNSKRIFMCRHGETEYNRLKKVQGARIDAPLNDTGERQAKMLGLALSYVQPQHIYHSSLLRARQTASIASQQLPSPPALESLPSLKEIDFGNTADGAHVSMYRAQMTATYAAWAIGDSEARMTVQGESLAEVQERVRMATLTMLDTDASCVAAVSHSSYLRVFLSTVDQGFSLTRASSLQIPNCSIHVVDFDKRPRQDLWYGKVVRTSEARHLSSTL